MKVASVTAEHGLVTEERAVPEPFDRKKACLKSGTVQFSSWYTLKHLQYTVGMWDSGRMDPSSLVTRRVDLQRLGPALEPLQRPNEMDNVIITPAQVPA